MSKKYVYLFAEGNAQMRALLGGKGANLAEMTNLGLPVPYGFTVTTEACTQYYADGKRINDEINAEIFEYLKKLEAQSGKPATRARRKQSSAAQKAEKQSTDKV